MSERNPYIHSPDAVAAKRGFKVRFEPPGVTVAVDPRRIPYGNVGLAGSLLDIALAHGVPIDHACGGVCACSTCHVVVREGFDSLSEVDEAEEDMLDNAPGLTPTSRLAWPLPPRACSCGTSS